MTKPLRFTILMLLVFITLICYLWDDIVIAMSTPTMELFPLNFPSDKRNQRYSTYYIEKNIRSKRQIRVGLDWNDGNNEKKFEFIRYEARKLKYTSDTTAVVVVMLSEDVSYSTIIRLVRLCIEDQHMRYTLIKNAFVVWGEYPRPKKTENSTQLIYF